MFVVIIVSFVILAAIFWIMRDSEKRYSFCKKTNEEQNEIIKSKINKKIDIIKSDISYAQDAWSKKTTYAYEGFDIAIVRGCFLAPPPSTGDILVYDGRMKETKNIAAKEGWKYFGDYGEGYSPILIFIKSHNENV